MNKCSAFTHKTLVLLLFFFSVETAFTQSPKETDRPLRLFMIGNSFSQNASKYLPELSRESGYTLIIGRAEIGGASLQRHWSHVEAAEQNADDPKGKPYGGKSLKTLLSDGIWDVVTIQQASIQSGDSETYRPYARNLYDFIKKLQPNAAVVFHETWAYRTDSNDFSRIAPGDSARNTQQMWEHLRTAYQSTANDLAIPIIPNGDAFWRINSSKKWAYHKDNSFDFQQAKPPTLPNQTHSLHVGYRWDKNKLAFDAHHANAAGCYLGALVWYSFLFNKSPNKLTFHPDEVDEDFTRQLKKTAWRVVKKTKRQSVYKWVINH